jgi:ubiquitin-protein ligase E3 A
LRSFSFSEEDFIHVFSALRMFVTVKLSLPHNSGFADVGPVVHVLDLLHKVNQSKKHLDYKEFYNDGVNSPETVSLKSDYARWKDSQRAMDTSESGAEADEKCAFCHFPFLLDPASKARILKYDAEFQMRDKYRQTMMLNMMRGQMQIMPFLVLKIRRENIVEDTMTQIARIPPEEFKKPLKVQFVGEEGVDEGGVQKEFFLVMIRKLLDPQYAMFKVNEDTRLLWFNSASLESRVQFELIGILMGIAIYNSVILDVRFPPVLYRRLMGKKPTFEDLRETEPDLGKGLQQMLDFEGDVMETYQRSFQITEEVRRV